MRGQQDSAAGGQPSFYLLPSLEKAVPFPWIFWALALRFQNLAPRLRVGTGGDLGDRSWGPRPRMPPALGHHCIHVMLRRTSRGDLLAMETQDSILPGGSSCPSVTLQVWGTENRAGDPRGLESAPFITYTSLCSAHVLKSRARPQGLGSTGLSDLGTLWSL